MKRYTPEQVRALRHKLGLTQAVFAALIGYSKNHIAQVERGERPIHPRMARILDALK